VSDTNRPSDTEPNLDVRAAREFAGLVGHMLEPIKEALRKLADNVELLSGQVKTWRRTSEAEIADLKERLSEVESDRESLNGGGHGAE
jgi:hypothetical protein